MWGLLSSLSVTIAILHGAALEVERGWRSPWVEGSGTRAAGQTADDPELARAEPAGISHTLNAGGAFKRNGQPWTRQALWLLLDNHDARAEARGA